MSDNSLMKLAKGSGRFIAFTSIMQVLKGSLYIVQVYAIAGLIKYFSQTSDVSESSKSALYLFLAIFCGVIVLKGVVSYLENIFAFKAASGVKSGIRQQIFSKINKLGPGYAESHGTAEIISNTVDGVESMEVFFGRFMPQLFSSLILPLILFAAAAPVNIICAAVLLAAVPVIPLSMMFISKWAKRSMGNFWSDYESLSTVFLENLQGLVTLKLFNRSGKKLKEMEDHAEGFRKSTMGLLRMQLTSITVMDTLVYGMAAAGIILSLFFFYKKSIDIAGVTILILLSVEFFLPVRKLGSFFHAGVNGIQSGKKIAAFLATEAEVKDNGKSHFTANYDIEFNHLSFGYRNSPQILSDTSFCFKQGHVYGLAGKSGCGKSTIASLLLRFYDPTSGSIKIGGVDIRNCKLNDLRKKIVLVSNNSTIFSGTVRDNLKLADASADDQKLMSYCCLAGFADSETDISILDKSVGEQGSMISGGQRQRLAFARALLVESDILVLDEITASVDLESEKKIAEAVSKLKGCRTIIVISHRSELLENVDSILTIRDKQIVEQSRKISQVKEGKLYG